MSSSRKNVSRPLDGVLVVALEQAVAAPYCSSRLADAGARVIKVEPIELGDPTPSLDQLTGLGVKPFDGGSMVVGIEAVAANGKRLEPGIAPRLVTRVSQNQQDLDITKVVERPTVSALGG